MLNLTELIGLGVGGGGKRFWRIVPAGSDILDAGEVTFYATPGDTGHGLLVGGIATAQNYYGAGFEPDKWTDKDTNTQFYPATGGAWWQYELPSGIDPKEILIASTVNIPGIYKGFSVYWSENGTDFVLQKTIPSAYYANTGPEPITGSNVAWSRLSLL